MVKEIQLEQRKITEYNIFHDLLVGLSNEYDYHRRAELKMLYACSINLEIPTMVAIMNAHFHLRFIEPDINMYIHCTKNWLNPLMIVGLHYLDEIDIPDIRHMSRYQAECYDKYNYLILKHNAHTFKEGTPDLYHMDDTEYLEYCNQYEDVVFVPICRPWYKKLFTFISKIYNEFNIKLNIRKFN